MKLYMISSEGGKVPGLDATLLAQSHCFGVYCVLPIADPKYTKCLRAAAMIERGIC